MRARKPFLASVETGGQRYRQRSPLNSSSIFGEPIDDNNNQQYP